MTTRNRHVLYVCLLTLLAGLLVSAPVLAAEAAPGWELFASTYPTNFLPGGVNEVQQVTPDAGETHFTLESEGESTTPIAVGAPAGVVRAELEALASVGKDNVEVEEEAGHAGVYLVKFQGPLGDMKRRLLGATGAEVAEQTAGSGSGTIGIDVFNVGAAASSGTITVTDVLPPGVEAREAGALRNPGQGFSGWGIQPMLGKGLWDCTGNGSGGASGVAGATVVTCINDPVALPSLQGGGGTPEIGEFLGNEHNNPLPVIGISVEAKATAADLTNHVSISGGGALDPAGTENPVAVSTARPTAGIAHADAWFSNANGTVDTQAGSHPYTATFAFDTATAINSESEAISAAGEVRNLETRVPPGFVGDLHNIAQCTREQLLKEECPASSMVGTLKVSSFGFLQITKQVFNMATPPGVPAELGFEYGGVTTFITFTVDTGGDYSIIAHVHNLPQKEVFQSILTLWGVPAESTHDRWRGTLEGGCSEEEMEGVKGFGHLNYCTHQPTVVPRPFLTLPTSCGAAQLFSFRELSSWQDPNSRAELPFVTHDSSAQPIGFTGCESLPFESLITTAPDTGKTDTPTGLTVEVKPATGGLETVGSFSSADIQNTVVALPAGLVINPGQAAGLQACGAAEDALTTPAEEARGEVDNGPAKCPDASKIGTVVIKSPLIETDPEKQFEGNVYVLQSNPPEIRLLVAASADGVNLKLVGVTSLCEAAGEALAGKACEAPGQIIASFDHTPQLPFTVFKLSFSGGAQAALDTPTHCGTYTANADFTPWSSPLESDFLTSSQFTLGEGAGGSGCPGGQLPFAPSMTAGTTTDKAGVFTGFSMLLQRGDGQQRIEKLQFKAPAGLAAMISSVPVCDEADANAGTCPATSRIGHSVVASGPGPFPLVLPQPGEPELPIYLTGPYKGASFGLSIVTPVLAGPFNLGTIVTRSSIEVDPQTAQITVTTDPLPQMVKGVPTDLRSIDAVIDRERFMFNPSNCQASSFSGTAWGTAAPGVSEPPQVAPLSTHFGIGSCRELVFKPKLSISTAAHASRRNGASLNFKISYPKGALGTQAWFKEAKFTIPKQLPAELKTIQQACIASTFATNRAACPKHSVIGHAVVHTPVLPVALEGPVYFVSHGGAKFPDVVLVLAGDNVNIHLIGETFINSKTGVTSATFPSTPDVPFESIEVQLPAGEFSEFGANLPHQSYDFCGRKLTAPTLLKAQNGLEINQNTPVTVTGCAKAKAKAKVKVKASRKKHKR